MVISLRRRTSKEKGDKDRWIRIEIERD